MEKNIILASTSPRRKSILESEGINFTVIPSDYEELFESLEFSYNVIEKMAYNKANAVAEKINENSLVIGADTVVVLENMILGKPKDKPDATNMLKSLSGKTHIVVTSICVINTSNFEHKISSVTSHVEFEILNNELINNYIEEFKPFDKAGSYGIQELPDGFVKKIEGSFENIMGLCPERLTEMLRDF